MNKFFFHLIEAWPPLAWAAECSKNGPFINVYHGVRVETSEEWFCEAVWDDDFEAGNFDTTDLVFGSGGRLRNGRATFISSGATVDRLQTLDARESTWVSNSLACLLTVTKSELDPTSERYMEQMGSIVKGIRSYERELQVSNGVVRFTYFHNLQWNGFGFSEVEKPNKTKTFSTFESYRDFLQTSLQSISDNLQAHSRMFPYKMLGTLSSGYDSSTNTILAHKLGLNKVLSFSNTRNNEAAEAKKIADRIGIQLEMLARDQWRSRKLVEALFIAADAKGEDVYFSVAENHLAGTVLLTGFHGDKVWAKENTKLDPFIIRGDRSGLSLTEYRLLIGFVHLPLPFAGVRQIEDLHRISNSEEMKPWDIPGSYSRPICRRIVEEAGVPRNYFGIKKKASSVLFGDRKDQLTSHIRLDLMDWLQKHEAAWATKSKISAYKQVKRIGYFAYPLRVLKKGIRIANRLVPAPLNSPLLRLHQKLDSFSQDGYLFRYAFPWAIDKLKEHYSPFNRVSADEKDKSSRLQNDPVH